MRCCCAKALLASLLVASAMGQPAKFYLQDGDRVTFYGDSITAQRFYTRDVQDFVATRYPHLNVSYHNAGVPGDKVGGGYTGSVAERVKRDVAPWNPTVITVMLGMNDGDYMAPDAGVFAEYQSGYQKLLDVLAGAAPRARITLLENTAYDEVTHGTEFAGYMKTTEQNARSTVALGARNHLPVVDTLTPVLEVMRRAVQADQSFASLLVPDRIHPSEPLHWVMAAALMKAWGVDPVVSRVELSAKQHAIRLSKRTSISDLSGNSDELRWTQLDDALPLPFNLDNALALFVLRISDLGMVDQETLQVDGLAQGSYQLTIDKMMIGAFSAEQLADGIELGMRKTPMWAQARDFDSEIEQRSDLEHTALLLNYSTKVQDRQKADAILREGEAEFEQHAQADLQMKKHRYLLTHVSDAGGQQ